MGCDEYDEYGDRGGYGDCGDGSDDGFSKNVNPWSRESSVSSG